jgi:hypothetical protein
MEYPSWWSKLLALLEDPGLGVNPTFSTSLDLPRTNQNATAQNVAAQNVTAPSPSHHLFVAVLSLFCHRPITFLSPSHHSRVCDSYQVSHYQGFYHATNCQSCESKKVKEKTEIKHDSYQYTLFYWRKEDFINVPSLPYWRMHAPGTRVWPYYIYISSFVVSSQTSNTTVELFIVLLFP